jgi:chromosome segregation ATPase
MVDAMAQSNNPVRTARAIRDQVEARVVGVREELEQQWQNERKRLTDEIERLKTGVSADDKKQAVRLALLQKLGKVPAPAPMTSKAADEWASEFQNAKAQWDAEREQLQTHVQRLGSELQQARDVINNEGVHEIRAEYELKLIEANRERYRLEQDIRFVTEELASERQRLTARTEALEAALPQAQEVSRKQTLAELQNQLDAKIEEANRVRSRMERNYQEAVGNWEDERRRAKKQLETLEEELREARESAYKAQKNSSPSISS